MRTLTITLETVLGIVILSVVVGVLASMKFPLLLLAYAAPGVSSLMNVLWMVVILGMIKSGFKWSKPGFAIAPFLFAALWFGASVVDQSKLEASIDPKVWNAPISSEASAQRTLTIDSYQGVERRIMVDGHVDKLIKVHHDGSTQKIVSIEEITSAKGDACSLEERRASPEFQNLGRGDECFKWRDIGEIPDGLVIEHIHRFALVNGVPGCCNETQARLRIGGKERLLFSWYQGQAYVLSSFPKFGFFPHATRLWEPGEGLMHPVRYGLDNIEPRIVASAIYGVDPVYKVDSGFRPPSVVSAEDALVLAESLAKLANVSQKAVAALLISARDRGLVTERSIDIAASLVGHEAEGWVAVSNYVSSLTSGQTEALLEKLLQRFETPKICEDCLPSRELQNFSLSQWKLKERLSHPDVSFDQARQIFGERSDLATWQYEAAVRIMIALAPQGSAASDNFSKDGSYCPCSLPKILRRIPLRP